MARIEFSKEKTIECEDTQKTVLDVALDNGIPHEHACGGNGLCSTCRVLVLDGLHNVRPRNDIEQKLARAKGLEDRVRLACQTRILGDVSLRRLVLDKDDINLAIQQNVKSTGKQQQIAVLFSDIRHFTPFVESNLAYDVVHILNRYFYQMGQAVLRHDGFIDKYMGDGMMALFGVDSTCPMQSCLDAVSAGLEMLDELNTLNHYLATHFEHEIAIGIGIDFGEALVGDLGHPEKKSLTAIGNTVNVAARIEAATKGLDAKLLVSDSVYSQVKKHVKRKRFFHSELKGTASSHLLHEITQLTTTAGTSNIYESHFQRLENKIRRSDAPGLLRLAFHDAFSFDPVSLTGGLNGSILLPEESQRPENAGLQETIGFLQSFSGECCDMSNADLVAMAATVAIYICGGPRIKIRMGRQDSENTSTPGQLPDIRMPFGQMLARFESLGFNAREVVALSGAHTLGMANGKAFTDDLFAFNNRYFKDLMQSEESEDNPFLPSDLALLNHPDTKKWVYLYALDEKTFFDDFSLAFKKMLNVGALFFG